MEISPDLQVPEREKLEPYTPETLIADYTQLAMLQSNADSYRRQASNMKFELSNLLVDDSERLIVSDPTELSEEQVLRFGSLSLSSQIADIKSRRSFIEAHNLDFAIRNRLFNHHGQQKIKVTALDPTFSPIHAIGLSRHGLHETVGEVEEVTGYVEYSGTHDLCLGIMPGKGTRFFRPSLSYYSAKVVTGSGEPLVSIIFED